MQSHRVLSALKALRNGKPIVIVDDVDRENEGDLVVAAQMINSRLMNFMARHGKGLICLSLEGEVLDRLRIGPMDPRKVRGAETNFAASIDFSSVADGGGGSGIGAGDRAATVLHAISADAKPGDFRCPGHVFPLRYTPGGTLVRRGHTEASVDMARLADLHPSAVICEIMDADGSMLRGDKLAEFARKRGLTLVAIADIVRFRQQHEVLVRRSGMTTMPTAHGLWRIIGYHSIFSEIDHMALLYGKPEHGEGVLTRIHSECLTGDVFGSKRCDCGEQLELSMDMIRAAGCGIVIYLRGHEGRGIGLSSKIEAYELQDNGYDTVDANCLLGLPIDARDYSAASGILKDLEVRSICQLTNNPAKIKGLRECGVRIKRRMPLVVAANASNARYLETKRVKMGHAI
jgi:3,4-dihydroxy 2-butanone 4-phosphate synthase / GTP cyclohydrolase II